MASKKLVFALFVISIVITTAGQLLFSTRAPDVGISSNHGVAFSTSYIHITNDENELIIAPDSTRGQIFSIIEQHPGIHFREICQVADKEVGVVQYHVQVLMAFKNISQFRDGRYARYVVNNSTLRDGFTRTIVAAWNHPLDKQILSELYKDDKKRHSIATLARTIGMSRQAISAHVKRLKSSGVVGLVSVDADGTKIFALTGPAKAKLDYLSTRHVIECNPR
ncbi:MAG: winged helix-turn-helix transcriptional regulator [Candidatus Sigynarchaeota archaeon]